MEAKAMEDEIIKRAEHVDPAEVLENLVKSNGKEDAAKLLEASLSYFLAKKKELAKVVKDINQFLSQNKELMVIFDPAVMVSVSLRDPESEASMAALLKGPGSPRSYAFEAALGRGPNLKAACEHIVGQADNI